MWHAASAGAIGSGTLRTRQALARIAAASCVFDALLRPARTIDRNASRTGNVSMMLANATREAARQRFLCSRQSRFVIFRLAPPPMTNTRRVASCGAKQEPRLTLGSRRRAAIRACRDAMCRSPAVHGLHLRAGVAMSAPVGTTGLDVRDGVKCDILPRRAGNAAAAPARIRRADGVEWTL